MYILSSSFFIIADRENKWEKNHQWTLSCVYSQSIYLLTDPSITQMTESETVSLFSFCTIN